MRWELLLVDDEPCLLELLAELLTEDDINVTIAANGKVALEMLQNKHFDVVVSDVNMPMMDGLELIQSARDLGIYVPTIFFSAESDEKLVQNLKDSGAVAVVKKPHFERLSSELNSVLTLKQFTYNRDTETVMLSV